MQQLTTQSELVKFFYANKNAVRGTVVIRTPVKMNKRDVATKTIDNPNGAVFKVQTVEVEFNPNYEIKVNTARMLEGKEQDFESEARKWGVKVNDSIVEKNGQLYLFVVEEGKVGSPVYETETGEKVEYAAIQPFMPAYNSSKKQGLEDDVKARTYKLENVIGAFIPSMQVRFNPNK